MNIKPLKRFAQSVVLLMGIAGSTFAQEDKSKSSSSGDLMIMPELGLNFSNYKYTVNPITLDTKDRVSLRVGASADMRLHGSLFLEAGVFYAGNGFKFSGDNGNGGTGTALIKVNAIEIPVIFQYFFESRKHNVFFVGLGPAFTFNMSGTAHVDDGAGTVTDENLTFGNSTNDFLKKLDISIATEIGFKFARGVYIKIAGMSGLVNLATDAEINSNSSSTASFSTSSVRSTGGVLAVGYSFPLGTKAKKPAPAHK